MNNQREIVLLNEVSVFDAYVMYQFLKKLTTPFNQTEAFKLGIIDASGKVLRKRSTLKTPEERAAFTIFDVLVFNLRKILEKIPGGKSMIASYTAALFLLKEQKNIEHYEDPDLLYEAFLDFFESILLDNKSQKELGTFLMEEKRSISSEEAISVGNSIGLNWSNIDLEEFRVALGEHDFVNNLDEAGRKIINYLNGRIQEDGAGGGAGAGGGVPANNAGSGHIAGLPPDEPPIRLKKKKSLKSFDK